MNRAEKIDATLECILAAVGTRLKDYPERSQENMRKSMRSVMSAVDEYIAGGNSRYYAMHLDETKENEK